MAQKPSRTDRLFGRRPSEIPKWMAIRDADAKQRNDIGAKLKAARLARDATLVLEAATHREKPRGRKKVKRQSDI